ncbi:MAG: hypothetical protein WCS15_10495 [Prevotella sp.]
MASQEDTRKEGAAMNEEQSERAVRALERIAESMDRKRKPCMSGEIVTDKNGYVVYKTKSDEN